MTTTKTETNKARDARIDVQEAATRFLRNAPRDVVDALRVYDAAMAFASRPQPRNAREARVLERVLAGALGTAKAHHQTQRDLLAIWVAYANWKSAAR